MYDVIIKKRVGGVTLFDGKYKALTFSYDDGVRQDIRLIELFNKYKLKATFNLNSGVLGAGKGRIKEEEIHLYDGHEIAAHTLSHPNLTDLNEREIIRQVEWDRKELSEICGYEVEGMAYPCGGVNNDDRVAEIIKKNTAIKYARTITSSYSFEPQDNLLRFNPTVYHLETEQMFKLAEEFIDLKANSPKILYIWGHSFEFDRNNSWEQFEDFCKMISGRNDIFYGTNKEVLL